MTELFPNALKKNQGNHKTSEFFLHDCANAAWGDYYGTKGSPCSLGV
jgi:hypothetical protein